MTQSQHDLKMMLEASQASDEGRPSPLTEIDPHSLDELFERINSKLALGMPETIDDEKDLAPMVAIFRMKRIKFLTEKQKKDAEGPKRRGRASAPKSVAEVLNPGSSDIDELENF